MDTEDCHKKEDFKRFKTISVEVFNKKINQYEVRKVHPINTFTCKINGELLYHSIFIENKIYYIARQTDVLLENKIKRYKYEIIAEINDRAWVFLNRLPKPRFYFKRKVSQLYQQAKKRRLKRFHILTNSNHDNQ